jgi:predicted nucleotidyltransferase
MVENDRIHSLFRHFPLLFSLVKKLNENKIDFVISGSACLYVFGNERFPLDLDIFLKNKDHDLADKIFDIKSFSFSSDFEVVRNSNPFGDSAFQLTSNLMLLNSKQTLDFSINDNILKNRVEAEYGGEKVFFMPPEEVLLTKSFLNRGPDVGKHDAEDIKNFLKVHKNLNTGYIASRLEDLNIKNRLNDFKYCDLLFKINKKDMEKNESKKEI